MSAPDRIAPDWIAVDWGTSHLRAMAMRDGRAVAQAASDDGIGRLGAGAHEGALVSLIRPWLTEAPTTVIACGMVGSRQGWVEAPYRPVPGPPLGSAPVPAPVQDARLRLRVVPGLRQDDPPDVMRGEETQAAGFLALNPGWDGVICLPGTHSKWLRLRAGAVLGFRTFLTGEMFALLSTQSVLRHSVAGWDEGGFDEGLSRGLDAPEGLSAWLFAIRAEGLLHGLSPARARSRLSGLLIGAELSAARAQWQGRRVALVGAPDLTRLYARGLSALGMAASSCGATEAVLAGLARVHDVIGAASCAR